MLRIIDKDGPLAFSQEDLDLTIVMSPPTIRVGWFRKLINYGLRQWKALRGRENGYRWDRRTGFHDAAQLS